MRQQLSWDVEEPNTPGYEAGSRRSSRGVVQAFFDPGRLLSLMQSTSEENIEDAEETVENGEDDDTEVPPENYKKDSGYGSQGQLKDVKPVAHSHLTNNREKDSSYC